MKDFFDQFNWDEFALLFALVAFCVPIIWLIIADFLGFAKFIGVLLGLCTITFVIYMIIWAIKASKEK